MTGTAVSLVMHGSHAGVPPAWNGEIVETGPSPSFTELNSAAARASKDWILFLPDGADVPGDALDGHLGAGESPDLGAVAIAPLPLRGAGNLLVRAAAFESAGGFFEDVRAGAALDLVARLAELGWEVRGSSAGSEPQAGLAQKFREGAARFWLSRRHGGPRMPSRRAGIVARLGAVAGSNRLEGTPPGPARHPSAVVWTDAYPARSETFIYNEVGALRELGWEVRVESAARPSRIEQAVRRRDRVDYLEDEPPLKSLLALARLVSRHPVRCFADLGSRRRWGLEEDVRPLRAIAPSALRLARQQGAHVHVHFLAGAALSAMRICRITGAPFTAIGHGYDVFERPANLQEKLGSAAIAIAPCEYTADYLRQMLPKGEGRVEVIVMGIDAERFRRDRRPADGRRVAAVGRLVAKKGFEHLIEATAILAHNSPLDQLTIVGDGPLRGELEALTQARGLDGVVQIVDAWGADAVASILEAADVFAMPAVIAADGDRDAMPVVVKEAMAMELPVVASDEVGLPELVSPDVGRLVPPGDPMALANAIEDILSLSPESRHEMGARGRARVLDFCSISKETQRLAELFVEARDVAQSTRVQR